MSLLSMLTKTPAVQSATSTKDAIGSPSVVFANRIASVPCALWPASAKTVNQFAQLQQVAQYEMATATDIACQSGERVIVGGQTYAVLGYQRFEGPSPSGLVLYSTILGKVNQP